MRVQDTATFPPSTAKLIPLFSCIAKERRKIKYTSIHGKKQRMGDVNYLNFFSTFFLALKSLKKEESIPPHSCSITPGTTTH
ncbi:hypothetical protein BACI349Y_230008 [Bacillus sp. 349Y]|nr:hypothetical protein BACI349Y_230008 [Bacillus sp. 349Y]